MEEKKHLESFKNRFQTGNHFKEFVSNWYTNRFAPRIRIPGNQPTGPVFPTFFLQAFFLAPRLFCRVMCMASKGTKLKDKHPKMSPVKNIHQEGLMLI